MRFRQKRSWSLLLRLFLSTIPLICLILLTACSVGTPPPPDKTIYAVSENGTVYAVRGKDGSMLWSQHMSGDNGSLWGHAEGLTLENGIIYTSSSVDGGYTYAFRAQTGKVLWHTQLHSQGLPSSPMLANGIIYLSTTDSSLASSHIYAFKAADGSFLWGVQVKGCASSPLFVNGSLYLSASICTGVGEQTGYVYALNADHGSLRWQHQLGNTVFQQIVLNDVVYSDDGATIFAFGAENGSSLWQKTIRADALIGIGNTLYASVNSTLYALRASNGKQLWQVSMGHPVPYNLTVVENTIYAVSFFDPGIYAFSTSNGSPLWNYQTQASSAGSFPMIDNSIVYFSTLDGTIYELATNDGSLVASYAITNAWLFTHAPLVIGP